MSLAEAKALFQKIDSDAAFRAHLTAIEEAEKRVAFINTQGFNLTLQEIRIAMDILSDEELDSVAGGLSNPATVSLSDLFF